MLHDIFVLWLESNTTNTSKFPHLQQCSGELGECEHGWVTVKVVDIGATKMREMQNGGVEQWSGEATNTNANSVDDEQHERKVTAFERLSLDLSNDPKVMKEITLGKRIGFYRIRGELGSGNFSQVKMGIHALTKGKSVT